LRTVPVWWSSPMSSPTQTHSEAPSTGRGAPFGPLRGIKVLDLTRLPPGGHCTVALADLGADVIRLESPGAAGQPSLVVGQVGLSRGKRSATLNLRHARGTEVLTRLAGSVDVLVENNAPGELEGRGFGYPQAAERFPRLIWCSVTGFGQEGPYADRAGHDLTYTAHSGLLTALSPDLPWHPRAMLAVPLGAMAATSGILAALYERATTGRGCQIDVSLADAATWVAGALDAPFRDEAGGVPFSPDRRLYQCGDGEWITVAAAEPRTWQALCDGIGAPELAADGVPGPDRHEAVTAQLSSIFSTRTASDWVDALGPLGAAVGAVNTGRRIAADPHNATRGTTTEVAGVTVAANPIRLRDGNGDRSTTATEEPPVVGQHTDAVLREAGYTADEIGELRADGVV